MKSSEDQNKKKSSSKNSEFLPPKSSEDQKKKVFVGKFRVFVPEIEWRPKKKVLHRNLGLFILPEFVGFISADKLFFFWSFSTQLSIGES